MVKRNYGLNCFKNLDESLFEYASNHDLSSLEIHLDKTYTTVESFTDSKIEKLNQLAKDNNVRMALHNMHTVNIADILPYYRKKGIKYILEIVSLANKIDASHITAHIGSFYWFPAEKSMRKKALDRFIKSVGSIMEECEKKKVCFALENAVPLPFGSEYYYLGDHLEDFHYIFSRLDSDYFQLCLDTGHANVGDGVLNYITEFSSRIRVIHYHDNKGDDDNHLPVGEGTVDWIKIAEALAKIEFTGPFISECREIDPHEAAKRFEKYFEYL